MIWTRHGLTPEIEDAIRRQVAADALREHVLAGRPCICGPHVTCEYHRIIRSATVAEDEG